MRRTTIIGALGLVVMFAAIGFGQTVDPAKLKVNGVGLDSTYARVVKALGKPVKNGPATEEGCIGGREKYVEFDGARFYFMDGDSKGGKTFEVKSFNITAPKYVVSGLKVGDTELAVRRRLGSKFVKQDDEESGAVVWSYEFPETGNPGFTSIYIKRGKIVKIAVAAMVC